MIKLYAKPGRADHRTNNIAFEREILAEYPQLSFAPASSAAPWHVKTVVATRKGPDIVLNFWPHLCKSSYGTEGARTGLKWMHDIIARAYVEVTGYEDFTVIEED